MTTKDENMTSLETATISETSDSTKKIADKTAEKKTKKSSKSKKKRPSLALILTLASIVLLFLSVFLVRTGIRNGAKALADKYSDNYKAEHDKVYENITEYWRKKIEDANKTKNYQSISIASVKEKADLEVLIISEVVYEIENKEDNKYHLTRWAQFPGTCTYTVNLKASEFITDTTRNTVTVRIPHIVSNIQINDNKIEELFSKDDIDVISSTFSKADVIKAEEDLVDRQLRDAYVDIRKKFQEEPYYEKQAKEAAVKVIEKLIRDLNPGNDTLQVLVEFVE